MTGMLRLCVALAGLAAPLAASAASYEFLAAPQTNLNRIYRQETALHQRDFKAEGFEWIDYRDAESSVLAFLRRGKNPDAPVNLSKVVMF